MEKVPSADDMNCKWVKISGWSKKIKYWFYTWRIGKASRWIPRKQGHLLNSQGQVAYLFFRWLTPCIASSGFWLGWYKLFPCSSCFTICRHIKPYICSLPLISTYGLCLSKMFLLCSLPLDSAHSSWTPAVKRIMSFLVNLHNAPGLEQDWHDKRVV